MNDFVRRFAIRGSNLVWLLGLVFGIAAGAGAAWLLADGRPSQAAIAADATPGKN